MYPPADSPSGWPRPAGCACPSPGSAPPPLRRDGPGRRARGCPPVPASTAAGSTTDADAADRWCAPCRDSRPPPAPPRSWRSVRLCTRQASDPGVRSACTTPLRSPCTHPNRQTDSPRFVILEWNPLQRLGRATKVVHAPGLLFFLKCERDGHRAIGLDARRPEIVVDVNGCEGNRLHRVIARRRLSLHTGEPSQKNGQSCNRFHEAYYSPSRTIRISPLLRSTGAQHGTANVSEPPLATGPLAAR